MEVLYHIVVRTAVVKEHWGCLVKYLNLERLCFTYFQVGLYKPLQMDLFTHVSTQIDYMLLQQTTWLLMSCTDIFHFQCDPYLDSWICYHGFHGLSSLRYHSGKKAESILNEVGDFPTTLCCFMIDMALVLLCQMPTVRNYFKVRLGP